MPEYLAPGVFIEEIERGPKPIEGVATSTAAFLGETERGPLRPRLVTSYNEYLRHFGGVYNADRFMPYAVNAFFQNGGRRCYITRVVPSGTGTASLQLGKFKIEAVGPGAAYTRIWARIGPSTTTRPDGSDGGSPVGFRLRVYHWSDRGPEVSDPAQHDPATKPPWLDSEDFDDLSLDEASTSHFEKRVNNGNSSYITISAVEAVNPDEVIAEAGGQLALPTGTQPTAAAAVSDFEGQHADPSQRTGLAALDLDEFREVTIVYAPNADVATAKAVVTHCERNTFRFAVIDSEKGVADPSDLSPRDSLADSAYAAFYYPWLVVSDPQSGARKTIPPGGAVCGIYALTDNTRGVFKAPANETVAGAIDLEYDINQGTQDVLNPKGVNVIRRFPGRGIRVWGARTMSSDAMWKYVSVRRLFIFLEASIYNSTQWVVFEPNDDRLWARVKQTLTLFLRTQWREGALFGAKEEEAFSVAIGRETMTEDDILNGRLIVEVGIAPVRPAEFVIFRVFQKTQEAK